MTDGSRYSRFLAYSYDAGLFMWAEQATSAIYPAAGVALAATPTSEYLVASFVNGSLGVRYYDIHDAGTELPGPPAAAAANCSALVADPSGEAFYCVCGPAAASLCAFSIDRSTGTGGGTALWTFSLPSDGSGATFLPPWVASPAALGNPPALMAVPSGAAGGTLVLADVYYPAGAAPSPSNNTLVAVRGSNGTQVWATAYPFATGITRVRRYEGRGVDEWGGVKGCMNAAHVWPDLQGAHHPTTIIATAPPLLPPSFPSRSHWCASSAWRPLCRAPTLAAPCGQCRAAPAAAPSTTAPWL